MYAYFWHTAEHGRPVAIALDTVSGARLLDEFFLKHVTSERARNPYWPYKG